METLSTTEYWEERAKDIIDNGLNEEDLGRLIELGLTDKTEKPTDETVMGKAKKRKEGIFVYLETQLGITQEDLLNLEGKEEAANLASSEILVRIIAACHCLKDVAELSETNKISEGDSERLKNGVMTGLEQDLSLRIWKGRAREETITVDGESSNVYHFLRKKGLTPGAGIKYLPEPENKMPQLLSLLEEKIEAKTS